MSQGFLIFAFNNGIVDYLKHALWAADRIDKYLGLPVRIVTDENSETDYIPKKDHEIVIVESSPGTTRIFDNETALAGEWKNTDRVFAYDLSPFDETIVIDSDYIVNSPRLSILFNIPDMHFLCHRSPHDVTGQNRFHSMLTFGQHKMPHYWATVLYFRKGYTAEAMFKVMKMIRNNYGHYAEMYKFPKSPMRNDYIVSIALTIINGHIPNAIDTIIPWQMPMINTDIDIKEGQQTFYEDPDAFELTYEEDGKTKHMTFCDDVHCMNKVALEKLIDAGV